MTFKDLNEVAVNTLPVLIAVGLAGALVSFGAMAQDAAPAQTTQVAAVYTQEQAMRGAGQYRAQCAQCHGAELQGDVGPALTGGDLAGWGTAAGVYEYYSVNMPPQAPGRLGDKIYTDILAFMLQRQGLPAGDTELPEGDLEAFEAISLAEGQGTAAQ